MEDYLNRKNTHRYVLPMVLLILIVVFVRDTFSGHRDDVIIQFVCCILLQVTIVRQFYEKYLRVNGENIAAGFRAEALNVKEMVDLIARKFMPTWVIVFVALIIGNALDFSLRGIALMVSWIIVPNLEYWFRRWRMFYLLTHNKDDKLGNWKVSLCRFFGALIFDLVAVLVAMVILTDFWFGTVFIDAFYKDAEGILLYAGTKNWLVDSFHVFNGLFIVLLYETSGNAKAQDSLDSEVYESGDNNKINKVALVVFLIVFVISNIIQYNWANVYREDRIIDRYNNKTYDISEAESFSIYENDDELVMEIEFEEHTFTLRSGDGFVFGNEAYEEKYDEYDVYPYQFFADYAEELADKGVSGNVVNDEDLKEYFANIGDKKADAAYAKMLEIVGE